MQFALSVTSPLFPSYSAPLSSYSSFSETDSAVDALPMLFLAYCTMTQTDYDTTSDDCRPFDLLTDDPTLFLAGPSSQWEGNLTIQLRTTYRHVFIPGLYHSWALSSTLSSNLIFLQSTQGTSSLVNHCSTTLLVAFYPWDVTGMLLRSRSLWIQN